MWAFYRSIRQSVADNQPWDRFARRAGQRPGVGAGGHDHLLGADSFVAGAGNRDLVLVHGLLMNSRMVQGVFDDLNAETRGMWKYPDGSAFDAERNNREFIENMALSFFLGMCTFIAVSKKGKSKISPSSHSI